MRKSNLRNLYASSPNQKAKLLRAIVYSFLNKVFDLAPPVLIGIAIDIVVEGEESFIAQFGFIDKKQQLIVLAFLTFSIWSLESLFDYIAAVTWRNISQDIEHQLRIDTYTNTQTLDLAYFESKSSGRLMALLNDDINQLERFLDTGAHKLIITFTTVFIIGGVYLYIDPRIALLAFIPIPIIIYGSVKFTETISSRYARIREAIETLNVNLSNSLTGVLIVKSFNRENTEIERINRSSKEIREANYAAIKLSSAFKPIIRVAILFGFTATLIAGGYLVLDGKLRVSLYSVLLFSTQRLLWPLTELGETFDLYQRAMSSLTRIFHLKETKHEIVTGKKLYSSLEKNIVIQNLSFSYVDSFPVLNNINLNIKAGETTALVGGTGSGKSTLLKLLLRLYEKDSGSINFDTNEIKELDISSLRKNIGLVSQDTFLFEGTIFENIAYGNLNASNEDIWEAARLAEAEEFIRNLPNKENTVVGERGQKLSGGQRQRISIARAIIKDPDILILDEATSSVDNETEAAIQRSLETLKVGRTVIVIAHRLSTIRGANNIYVLDNGYINEYGNHQELLDKNGIYKKLWDVQTGSRDSR